MPRDDIERAVAKALPCVVGGSGCVDYSIARGGTLCATCRARAAVVRLVREQRALQREDDLEWIMAFSRDCGCAGDIRDAILSALAKDERG